MSLSCSLIPTKSPCLARQAPQTSTIVASTPLAAPSRQRRRRCLDRPSHPQQQRWQQQRLQPAAAGAGPAGERNPQNVDQPQVLPSAAFSAEETVAVQLDALARNDQPWANHGVQTCYEFANDVGGLDPSYYFGFRKGLFTTKLGPLVNLRSYTIAGSRQLDDGETVMVAVEVQPAVGSGPAAYEFHLRRKAFGPRKGAWTTWALVEVAAANAE